MIRLLFGLIVVAAAIVTACSDEGPGPAASFRLTIVAGDSQSDTVGRTLAVAYAVRVQDTASTPRSGVTVTWSVTGGGGAVSPTSVTDDAGLATATRSLGNVAGTATARAAAGGASVTFTARALAAAPATITKSAGD